MINKENCKKYLLYSIAISIILFITVLMYENNNFNVDYEKNIIIGLIFLFIFYLLLLKNRQISKINRQMKKYIKIVDKYIITSTTNIDGEIIYASKAFCEISGYTKEELIGQKHNIVRHEDMPKELFKNLWKTIKEGKIWQGEIKNKKKNGDFYWVKATISPTYNANYKLIGFTSIREDITDKKRIEEISIRNDLTGIYNRRYFNEMFKREVKRAKRDNHLFSLIILDVDFFKLYNDNYGHQAGDNVLKLIAKKLDELCKRSSDFAFRLGGEEFAMIYSAEDKEKSIQFANIVLDNIQDLKIEHKYSNIKPYITVSIGLVCKYVDEISCEEIYKEADDLLYKAKRNGKNQVIFNID